MKIAILTNFRSFNDAYSLTHVVRNQVIAMLRYGHDVTLFVREDCDTSWSLEAPYAQALEDSFVIRNVIPKFDPKPYVTQTDLSEEHQKFAESLSELLLATLSEFDVIFTHDWILTSPNMPLAEALRLYSQDAIRRPCLHWIHSIPVIPFDWWDIKRYGPNHKVIYPNRTDRDKVSVLFGGDNSDVRVIPHIIDLRTHFDFLPETWAIVDSLPALNTASFVQIYPAAAERLSDKGVKQLLYTFKSIKKKGFSVCCLIVDSWAGWGSREDSDQYMRIAERNGLSEQEFSFMSRIAPLFTNATPRRVVRELMQYSSLFAYPTQGEAFGLTFPEASLAGNALPVLNRSLPMMAEIAGNNGLACNFGSGERPLKPANEREHYSLIARMIVSRAREDTTWQVRNHIRQNYNMDTIYREHYEPVLSESRLWK